MPHNKKIVIPVETKVRELDAKLWLALHLARDGHRVTVGRNTEVMNFIEYFDPDVFFGIGPVYRPDREQRNRHLKEAGRSIVLLETEGGAFKDDPSYFIDAYSDDVLKYVDKYFAWGEKSSELAKEHSILSDETNVITGNPRFDLLHTSTRGFYRERAEEIKKQYGPFVLINTNFGAYNSFGEGPATGTDVTEMSDIERFEQRILTDLIEFVRHIVSSMPDVHIVIRPHPGEHHETYHDQCRSLSNVSVIHEGDVRHWIQASDVLIHNNCTTGVEGVLMDHPVLAYVPESRPGSTHLSNRISHSVPDMEALVSAVEACVNGNSDPFLPTDEQMDQIQEYIANTDGKAAERIVESINALEGSDSSLQIEPVEVSWKDTIRRKLGYAFGPSIIDELKKIRSFTTQTKQKQKFSGVTREELTKKVETFNSLGFDFSNVSIEAVSRFPNVFTLT